MRVMDTKRISEATYGEVLCILKKLENDGNRHASLAVSLLEHDGIFIEDMNRSIEEAATSIENVVAELSEVHDRLSELINDKKAVELAQEADILRKDAERYLEELKRVN